MVQITSTAFEECRRAIMFGLFDRFDHWHVRRNLSIVII